MVLDIFSFEVCADVFSTLGAGGSGKLDLLQLLTPPGQDRLYLLEIIGVVGGDSQLSAGFQAADEILQIRRADQAPLVMTLLVPGVGEVDEEAVHGLIGHVLSQENGGIRADDLHIRQAPSAHTVDGVAIVPAGPFYPEEIVVGEVSSLGA